MSELERVKTQAKKEAVEDIELELLRRGLRESERRFHILADNSPMMIWMTDSQGLCTYLNRQWLEFTGKTIEAGMGKGWIEDIHIEDVGRVKTILNDAITKRNSFIIEYRLKRHNGEYRWILDHAMPLIDSGEITGFIGSSIDISERKLAEEIVKIRARQQAVVSRLGQSALAGATLKALMDEAVLLVAEGLDVEFGHVLEMSTDGQSMLVSAGCGWTEGTVGQSRLEVSSNSIAGYTLLLLSDEPVVITDINSERRFKIPKMFRDHSIVSGLSVTIRGSKFSFGVLGAYSLKPRNFTTDDINFIRSIANVLAMAIERNKVDEERASLLVREQEARKEAEAASRIKDEFLATCSHELRTPLTSILGWAKLLSRADLEPQTFSKAVSVIERNAKLQSKIIDDLLDISKIVSGKMALEMKVTEILPVVEAAIDTLKATAEAKGVKMLMIIDPVLSPVMGDSNRLQQVVWNLVANAIKFTPAGGSVEVTVKRADSQIEISVKDTGKGINPDFMPYLFKRFYQADSSITRTQGGLGLGLAIVRHIVELHGGNVSAESPGEGKGSTFRVRFPVISAWKEEITRTSSRWGSFRQPEANISLSGTKIVVVDDDPDTLGFMKLILAEAGAEVRDASSVDEALALFRKQLPDLIISDIGLPTRDGYELIREVRNLELESGRRGRGKVPAIALTAYTKKQDRLRALSSGYQVHLSKPIDPNELLSVIESILNPIRRRSR
ncbi:MAG: response regulator [Blastocatellia bacterium]|nr:response regulator [Blastocatellia bacterium]